ncbi:MAG TPA: hypothetical protein DC015_03915 [Aequorivita sp.]|nr:hypothetical protein [Aequorivita sp.]
MDRSKYIGSSDAISILNGNWHELWLLKTGRKQPDDLSQNFKVQLGIETEEFHLNWTMREAFLEDGNLECVHFGEKNTPSDGFYNTPPDGFYWLDETNTGTPFGSHPDGLIRNFHNDPKTPYYPVEVKHSGRFRSASDSCDFYMPQIMHHMLVMGSRYCLFSVIRGNEPPERFWVEANGVYIKHYVSRCIAFWNYILDDKAPPPFIEHAKPQTTIVDSIKRNGFKRRDLNRSNRATSLIDRYIVTKPVVDQHNAAKAELKALMADDEDELYHSKLTMKRNKRGSILFKLPKEEEENAH